MECCCHGYFSTTFGFGNFPRRVHDGGGDAVHALSSLKPNLRFSGLYFFILIFFSFLHARTPQAGSLLTHRPSCLHLHHSSSILLFLLCSSYSAPLWVTCFPANIYHISSWAGWVFKWTNETEWCIIYAAIIHRPDAGGADVMCLKSLTFLHFHIGRRMTCGVHKKSAPS